LDCISHMRPTLHNLIPDHLKRNRRTLRSTQLILRVDIAICIIGILLMPACFTIDFVPGAWISLTASILAAIHFVMLIKMSDERAAGHLFALSTICIFTSLSFFSSGVSSPFIVSLMTVPPIGFFYFKKEVAYFYSAITASAVILLFVIELLDILPTSSLDPSLAGYFIVVNLFVVSYLFFTVVKTFDSVNKKILKQLGTSNDKLTHSNKELERFASVASHDLKSPLKNMISFLGLFRRKHGKSLDANGVEYLDLIEANGKTMWSLIEDILEYSRAVNAEIALEPVDLNQTMKMVRSQIGIGLDEKSYQLNIDKMPLIQAEPTRMMQIFQNLVENGLKYNDSDYPKIDIKYHNRDNLHHFEVIDNGIGIDSKDCQMIFEMFRRLHSSSNYEGSGIGLATTKRSVEAFGGEIRAVSVVGRGSTFRIQIPVREGDLMPEAIANEVLAGSVV